MIVIIPHPTEELKLIHFQKELINLYNSDDVILYSSQVLWIEMENFSAETKENLKSISKDIKKVTLSSLLEDDDSLFIKVEIEYQDKKLISRMPLLKLYRGKLPPINKKCPVENLKIFRLGIPSVYEKNVKSLSDFVWHK